jgi:molecular chaperone HtpG
MERTIIGKDVIESLTTSMYDDPRFVYREYIQNSADAIDKARQTELVSEGEIHISIDTDKKLISIEDDATGIEKENVVKILKNIAQSTKQKGIDKGFRGIGRLGGLGYCDKLTFETSSAGENIKSIMSWDAKKLKNIINNRKEKEEATAVIDEVTSILYEKEDADKHYFRVTLSGVTNNMLLDVKDVRKYLSMVAPVPFKRSHGFSEKIYQELKKENIKLDEYNTFINTEQLFKSYNWYVYEGDVNNKRKIDEVIDVVFFKETNNQGKPLYWGWYGITKKNQSLNQINYARGFRLRKANIQIGSDETLIKLHRDRRFQFYFFGEIHALHPDITPNARRDNFSENDVYFEFEEKLKFFFHTTIHALCYDASKVNRAVKDIESYETLKTELKQKEEKGFINKEEKGSLLLDLEKKQKEAEQSQKILEKLKYSQKEHASTITKIIDHVVTPKIETAIIEPATSIPESSTKPTFRTDKLSKLNRQERKFLSDIFSIIKTVLPKDLAESLISKIEENYK